jgi:hypothetical protein
MVKKGYPPEQIINKLKEVEMWKYCNYLGKICKNP